jgi:hypothetical protein
MIITLTNGRKLRFDEAKALRYNETVAGLKHVLSLATDSEVEQERLHLTASGRWLLQHWKREEEGHSTWQEISSETAGSWFAQNWYQPEEIDPALGHNPGDYTARQLRALTRAVAKLCEEAVR